MLAAPVKLSMLLALEANCSLLSSTATQPQTPCWNCLFSCPQRELGSSFPQNRMNSKFFMGWIHCIPSFKGQALVCFPLQMCCPCPVERRCGCQALGAPEQSSWPSPFLLVFSRNKQGLRPNLLHMYGEYKSKLGMLEYVLSIHQQSRTVCSNSTRDPYFETA